jgi:hypothetical protein
METYRAYRGHIHPDMSPCRGKEVHTYLRGDSRKLTSRRGEMGDVRAQRLDELIDRVAGDAGVLPRGVRRIAFLRRLRQGPEQVAVGDVLALRRAGLEDEHIMEAVHVAVLLEICNRVVNALDVGPMGPDQNQRAATFLLRHGYQR